MIVAVHQPNYLPWLGYFYKIAHCDIFVMLDDVQFTKNGYQNRTRIKGPKEAVWLTQPVRQSGRSLQTTDTVEFDSNRFDWRDKHLKSLVANYSRAAHAHEILDACRAWLGGTSPYMATTNIQIIQAVARLLGLGTEIVVSSTLGVDLAKGDRLAEICRRLGASTYLSGHGARSYQHEEQFRDRGIELVYSDFAVREYPQLWGEFCPGLSIVDALFNVGSLGTLALLKDTASAT
jgi:hypothetical protein